MGSIPGLRRSPGGGNGKPLLSFPGAQLVKNKQTNKKTACNAGDPGSIPGLGRSAREGIGYPLQYSWASLVTQLVQSLPAMRETWV